MKLLKLLYWDRITSLLHFLLALTVTAQLLIAKVMKHHELFFLAHQINGLLILAIITAQWGWIFHRQNLFQHFFFLTRKNQQAIYTDCNELLKGKLPTPGPRPGLPGLIHCLGLLAVSGMAITGLIIFINLRLGESWHLIKHTHSFLANLVWIYWFGHVGAALAHQILKDKK